MQKTAHNYVKSLAGALNFRDSGLARTSSFVEKEGAAGNTCISQNLCTKYCVLRKTCTRKRIALLLHAIVMDIRHGTFYQHEYMNHTAILKNDMSYRHPWILSNGKQVSRIEGV